MSSPLHPQPPVSSPVTCVIVGAGSRGLGYATFATEQPARLRVVATAEPNAYRRSSIAKQHSIPSELAFADWRELLEKPSSPKPLADFALIATQDRDHAAPACALARAGYHILLEKPMAVSREDCVAIVEAAEAAGVMLGVCHVLRHSPCNRKIKEVIEEGRIGKVQHIQHTENVGWYHFAHSFVRGNWARENDSTFSLLAKSCHDVDLVRYWMGRECEKVSSFGVLNHFRREEAPANAADRCLDCEHAGTCPYSAVTMYLDPVRRGEKGWQTKLVDATPDIENVTAALRSGPYGRCAYRCDNDVCDNQVVNFQFEGGGTASFSMVACTEKLCVRETIVTGSHGQVRCLDGETVEVFDFSTRCRSQIRCAPPPVETELTGHGCADWFLMDSFVRAMETGDAREVLTSGRDALGSHLLVFAAEQARREERIVRL
mmetsp:Transcript_90592/g.233800  ORF Transcript_90592/g.233800 Transcript_90592/m.233800 type:complete len:433 (-) Transcript_90592:28-1326(-)